MIKLVDIIFSELLENKEYKIELKNGKSITKYLNSDEYDKVFNNMNLPTGNVKSITPTGKSTKVDPVSEPDDEEFDDEGDQPKDISVPTTGGIIYNNISKLLNTLPTQAKSKFESAKRYELDRLTIGTDLTLSKDGENAFIKNIQKFISPYFIKKEDAAKWDSVMIAIQKDVKFVSKFLSDVRSGKYPSKGDLLKYKQMLEKDKFLDKNKELYKNTIQIIKSEI